MSASLSSDDVSFLERAIEISRRSLGDEGQIPFDAIVVIDGQVISEGTSSVVELRDSTAHGRFGLTSREEEHLAGLNLVAAAKQSFKGSCDRGGEAAVLGEGLGGYQDQSRVSLSSSAVTAV